ncbi:unnamed protein product, partial [Ixodes persulcatus]
MGPCRFGACSQVCNLKKNGTFGCSCAPGFVKDHRRNDSCVAQGVKAFLLVASENELRHLDPYKAAHQDAQDLLGSLDPSNRIHAVDLFFNHSQTVVFWASLHAGAIYRRTVAPPPRRKEADDEEAGPSRRRRGTADDAGLLMGNLTEPRGLAVDWVGQLVYWVDAGMHTLSVASLDGKLRRTLISQHLDQPNDLAVDPHSRYLFWTETGSHPRVGRARLDGSDPRTLVDARVVWPTGVAVDHAAGRIYWADRKAALVETADLDGRRRHVVRDFPHEESPYRVDVFEDNLYVSTFPSNAILRVNKFGRGGVAHLVRGLHRATDVLVVQQNKQSPTMVSPCNESSCGFGALCIQRGPTDFACLCPDGMVETRTVDGTTACTIVAPTPTSADAKCDLDCLSGGTCVLGNNHQPLCRCPLGFGGKRCEHFLCSQFCKNKGLCILVTSQEIQTKRQNASSCRCPPQWTGQRCETSLNVCELCMRDGSCANGFADVRCKHCILRQPGNDLGRCTQEDPCRSQGGDEYCVHGVCRANSAGVRHCICAAGYIGDRCDTLSPMCESYCRNGGECFRRASRAKLPCACPPGMPGGDCLSPGGGSCGCLHGATCVTTEREGGLAQRCVCPAGFTGERCEGRLADVCLHFPCRHGGRCHASGGRPLCRFNLGPAGRGASVLLRSLAECFDAPPSKPRVSSTYESLPRSGCRVFVHIWPIRSDSTTILREALRRFARLDGRRRGRPRSTGSKRSRCRVQSPPLPVSIWTSIVLACGCGITTARCTASGHTSSTTTGKVCHLHLRHQGRLARRASQLRLGERKNTAKCASLNCSRRSRRGSCASTTVVESAMLLTCNSCSARRSEDGKRCTTKPTQPFFTFVRRKEGAHFSVYFTKYLPYSPYPPPPYRCSQGWAGVQCEQSTTCKGFCFNHGTCLPSPQDDELPSCLCARGFTGLRCQTSLSQGVAHSDRSAASDSLPNLLGAILIPVVVIVSVAVLLVLAVLIYRKRKRSRPFHHVRMQESSAGTGNVEISNPIYLRGDCEDDAAEALNASFSLDPDKATNFSNPVYDSLYADGAVNGEEKKSLLQGDLQVDYLDSQ